MSSYNSTMGKIKYIIFFCLLILFFLLGHISEDYLTERMISYKPEETPCSQSFKNLDAAADCLNEELKTFYNYNAENVGKKLLSLKELKEEGGVCYHYAHWYCDMAEELGYHCKTASFSVGEYGHKIAIVSDDTSYCVMDQDFPPKCYELEIPDE